MVILDFCVGVSRDLDKSYATRSILLSNKLLLARFGVQTLDHGCAHNSFVSEVVRSLSGTMVPLALSSEYMDQDAKFYSIEELIDLQLNLNLCSHDGFLEVRRIKMAS